jgi:hypothetical protein
MNDDYTTFYSNVLGLGVWSWWEMGLGVISGSLVVLRPLFHKLFGPSRGVEGRFLPDKGFRSQSPLNLILNPKWGLKRIRHRRSGSSESGSPFIRKSLIGWPLERARSDHSNKKSRYALGDDEDLFWGWGPKASSARTGKQKFGNITTVSSDGDWDGAVANIITSSRDSVKAKRISNSSSYYNEEEQTTFDFLAPLPSIPAATHTSGHHSGAKRGGSD